MSGAAAPGSAREPRSPQARARHRGWAFLLACLVALLVAGLASRLASPWRRDSHNDVYRYYESERIWPQDPMVEVVLMPFFHRPAPGEEVIPVVASKPAYVAARNLFSSFLRALYRRPVPQRGRLHLFTAATVAALAFVLAWGLGGRRDPAAAGLGAALALLTPWAQTYMHLPAYTQLSLTLLVVALLLAKRRSIPDVLGAGVVGALALMTNSAMIVYLFALGLWILWDRRAEPLRAARVGGVFIAGLLLPYAIPEVVLRAGYGSLWIDPARDLGPGTVLVRYYQRSFEEHHFALRGKAEVPKQPGMLLVMAWETTTPPMALLLLLLPLLAAWAGLLGGRARGLPPEDLRLTGCLIWVGAFGALCIDLKPGVQLGRTYFVAVPLLVVAGVTLAGAWLASHPRARPVALAVLVVHGIAAGRGLGLQRVAFLGLPLTVSGALRAGGEVALLEPDPHAGVLYHELRRELPGRLHRLASLDDLPARASDYQIRLLVTGPRLETIVTGGEAPDPDAPPPPQPVVPSASPLRGAGRRGVRLGEPVEVPWFGVHPTCVFEDEVETWRYLWGHFPRHAWRHGAGTVRAWPILPQARDSGR